MIYRIECKYSGKGFSFCGSLTDAIREACSMCERPESCWCVWDDLGMKMAECKMGGPSWVKGGIDELSKYHGY